MPGARRAVAAVLVVLVVGAPASAAAPGADGGPDGDRSVGPAVEPAALDAARQSQPENDTTRHENPARVTERGDLRDVQAWLAGRMGDRLEDSSVRISRAEYELARSAVGEDYRELLGKYVDVAGETTGADDDEAGEAFERAREAQREFAEEVRAYRQTREAYREAKENGNDERARRLARELERQAERINRTAGDLQQSYGRIESTTDVNLTRASTAVANVTENVSEQQAEIRRETFVATTLSLSVESTRISFVDPLAASGRLVAANGTPVANRRIRVAIGGRQLPTRTDDDGRFTVTYRPTTLPVGERTVTARYVPRNASVYLGSSGTVDVTVSQVEPTVAVEVASGELSFGDAVAVDGSVSAAGVGVPDVPVEVRLGDEKLGTARTDEQGRYAVTASLPASVDEGTRSLRVTVPLEGRAIAGAGETTRVSVAETATEIRLSARRVAPGTVHVSGALGTADGTPLAGQPVAVTVGTVTLETVRTDEAGAFEATVEVPGQFRPRRGNATVTLGAVFEREATNLGPARATGTVLLSAPDREDAAPRGPITNPVGAQSLLVVLAAGLLAVGLYGLLRRYRAAAVRWTAPVWRPLRDRLWRPLRERYGTRGAAAWRRLRDGLAGRVRAAVGWLPSVRQRGETAPSVEADATATDEVDVEGAADRAGTEPTALDEASDALAEGRTDEAVEIAYGSVRATLSGRLEPSAPTTHWEFLRACEQAELNGGNVESLERLTELYERAAFAPAPVEPADAERAVEVAATFAE